MLQIQQIIDTAIALVVTLYVETHMIDMEIQWLLYSVCLVGEFILVFER